MCSRGRRQQCQRKNKIDSIFLQEGELAAYLEHRRFAPRQPLLRYVPHEGRCYSPEAAGHHSLERSASEGTDVSTRGCGECTRARAFARWLCVFVPLVCVSPAACSQVAAVTAKSRSQRREVKKKNKKQRSSEIWCLCMEADKGGEKIKVRKDG